MAVTVSDPTKPLNVPTVTAPAAADALYSLLAIVGAVMESASLFTAAVSVGRDASSVSE